MIENIIGELIVVTVLGLIFYKALQVKDYTVLVLLNALGLFVSPGVIMATAMSSASGGTNLAIDLLLYGCFLGVVVCLVCLLTGFFLRNNKMRAAKYLRIPVLYAAIWTGLGILALALT